MQKSKIICNKPYTTIKLTKVSDTCIEPSPTSMMQFFYKNSQCFFFINISNKPLALELGLWSLKYIYHLLLNVLHIKTIAIFIQGLESSNISRSWIFLEVLESQEQVLYLNLYKIPLKVNVSGFIFSNVADLSSSKFIEK